MFVDVGQDRPTGVEVDMGGPIDFDVRVRRDQFAIRAVQHVHEAVLVGLDHDLAQLAINLEIGEDVLVGAIHVVHVVGRVLEITSDFTCLRPNREHAGRVQAVESPARPGIVRLGIARTPVDEVELRIVGTRAPRRPPTVHPGVAVPGPRLRTGLARRRDGVSAPQFLPGVGIPTVEEPARRGLPARHT